ncbi:hypothetical protein D3C75_1283760 [compost metagenome]
MYLNVGDVGDHAEGMAQRALSIEDRTDAQGAQQRLLELAVDQLFATVGVAVA